MLVLGIAGGLDLVYENHFRFPANMYHDAAAALVHDGRVVAAIEEERLNRIKHTNKLPVSALKFCLESYGVKLEDLDAFAVFMEEQKSSFDPRQQLFNPERKQVKGARLVLHQMFRRELGRDLADEKIRFVNHHLAHAMSAFAPSGFERSLILTIDGLGDNNSGMLLHGEGTRLSVIRSFPASKSLGHFYQTLIRFLGFEYFDEYKVMGLAPYGNAARFRHIFKRFYTLLADGDYATHIDRLGMLFDVAAPRGKDDPITATHQDIAAALQEALEEIVFHVLRHFQKKTGHQNLCLAGGVAQNCTLNGKVLASGLFENVFVQPAAHDSGCAIGAALYVEHTVQPQQKFETLEHVYWGTDVGGDDQIAETLDAWQDFIEVERVADIAERTAQLLAEGSVIGWVQGRSEFGPRALGNRSILADPRPAENKDIINAMVKKREAFRPFAPSVMEEYAGEFFEVPVNKKQFPFMIFVVDVAQDKRELLGAITHVDGTARIQTVSKKTNSRFWNLLDSFRKLTGVPVLLNTSFNNNVEPIVDSVNDAVVSFLTTKLHYLVVGDYLISKKKVQPEEHLNLVPSLPLHQSLHQSKSFMSRRDMTSVYEIRNTYNEQYNAKVSTELFAILITADGSSTVRELMQYCGINEDAKEGIVTELLQLWTRRMVILNPCERNGARVAQVA
jgi:carbamoyltransferase